jgi:hypothetical protein
LDISSLLSSDVNAGVINVVAEKDVAPEVESDGSQAEVVAAPVHQFPAVHPEMVNSFLSPFSD